MKIPKWLVATPILTLLLAATVYDIQSNGAPMGHTNAPGELTCNRSGCHTGNALNSGGASLSVHLGSTPGYAPGMVYPVTVEVSQSGKERFGFQVVALKDVDTTNAGTFLVTDSARTKVIAGVNHLTGRYYMTYKFPGTAAVAPGVGRWTFDWQAPTGTSSPITFYTAAAVANNDGTDQGEYIYTQVLTLPALPTAAPPASSQMATSTLFPNPTTGILHISYASTGKDPTTLHLCHLATRQTLQLQTRRDPPGTQQLTLDLRGLVPAGSYLLWISQGTHSHCHKFLLLP